MARGWINRGCNKHLKGSTQEGESFQEYGVKYVRRQMKRDEECLLIAMLCPPGTLERAISTKRWKQEPDCLDQGSESALRICGSISEESISCS